MKKETIIVFFQNSSDTNQPKSNRWNNKILTWSFRFRQRKTYTYNILFKLNSY